MIRKLWLGAILSLLSGTAAFAQSGSPITLPSSAITPTGQPIAGATVTVCQGAAWSSSVNYVAGAVVTYSGNLYMSLRPANFNNIPGTSSVYWVIPQAQSTSSVNCSPVVTVYSDPGLTEAITPPITTNLTGNVPGFVSSGQYVITVLGQLSQLYSVYPVNIGAIGGGGTGCFGGVNGNLLQGTGDPTACTNSGITTANVAQKPLLLSPYSQAAEQYVAQQGSDSNDGLSAGTPKATWDGACEALYGGGTVAGVHYCGTGRIHINNGIYACSNHGYGIQLMGNSGDPSYPYNGACWEMTTGPLAIDCVAGTNSNEMGVPTCTINGGSAADIWHPGLWMSANENSISFSGVQFTGQGRNIVLSVCANETEAAGCGTANTNFYGVATSPAQTSTMGPGWYIGENTLWTRIEDFSINGNSAATALTNDNAAAVLIGKTGGNGSGALNFSHGLFQQGGMVMHGGAGSSVELSDLETTEGNLEAAFWAEDGAGIYQIKGIELGSDCSGDCYAVRHDAGNTFISHVSGKTYGAAPILQFGTGVGTAANLPLPSAISTTFGSLGVSTWRANTEDAAHEFPALIVPGSPLVSTDINGISSSCGTCTETDGITDPAFGTQAIQISDTNSSGDSIAFPVSGDGGASVGRIFGISLWGQPTVAGSAMSASANNYATFYLANAGDTCAESGAQEVSLYPATSSNSWQHAKATCTVSAYASPGTPRFNVGVGPNTMQWAFPQLFLFPVGTTAEEANEFMLHLGSWPSTATAGQLATLAPEYAPITTPSLNNIIYVDGVKYAKTAAGILAALAAAGTNGSVILPSGKYSVTGNITVPSSECLIGQGPFSTILDWAAAPSLGGLYAAPGTVNACAGNLGLEFGSGATGATGIRFGNAGTSAIQYNTVRDVSITFDSISTTGTACIWTQGGTAQVSLNHFENIICQNAVIAVASTESEGNTFKVDASNVGGTSNSAVIWQDTGSGDEDIDARIESGSSNGSGDVCLSVSGTGNRIHLTCDTSNAGSALDDTGGQNIFELSLCGSCTSTTVGTVAANSVLIYTGVSTAPAQVQSARFATSTNCAGMGTAASPSVASCGSAAAGHFSCATNATGATCTVNTTAVMANSEIFVFESDTVVTGTALGVTCNTSTTDIPTSRILASSVAATSFTINLGTVTTNPACFSYFIVN